MISIFPFSHLFELLQVGWRFAEKLLITAKSAGNERTTQIPIVALPTTDNKSILLCSYLQKYKHAVSVYCRATIDCLGQCFKNW